MQSLPKILPRPAIVVGLSDGSENKPFIATRSGARQKTGFAIEILSDSETYEDILEKIQDYFDGGAELVWYIIPKHHKIYVYTSPDDIKVYKNADILSAAPLLPDFQFSVADLFA